jgi:hypothetical protein
VALVALVLHHLFQVLQLLMLAVEEEAVVLVLQAVLVVLVAVALVLLALITLHLEQQILVEAGVAQEELPAQEVQV